MMTLKLEFYDDDDFNKLIKKLKKDNLDYEIIGNKQDNTLNIYNLLQLSKANINWNIYVEFSNKNGKTIYYDLRECNIANYSIF